MRLRIPKIPFLEETNTAMRNKKQTKRPPKEIIADAAKALKIAQEKLELDLKQVKAFRKAMFWHWPFTFK
jgi:hypothetical protein